MKEKMGFIYINIETANRGSWSFLPDTESKDLFTNAQEDRGVGCPGNDELEITFRPVLLEWEMNYMTRRRFHNNMIVGIIYVFMQKLS